MKYSELAGCYEKIDSTTKRLEKTWHIAQFLKKVEDKELDTIISFLQGKIFPTWRQEKIGVAAKLILKAINVSTGATIDEIERAWKEIGDLGQVGEKFVASKKQATLFRNDLSVQKVFSNIRKMATMEGIGSTDRKIKLISELLTSAKGVEARYIIRVVLEDLRVGIGEGTLRDAICWAYLYPVEYDSEKNEILFGDDRQTYNEKIEVLQEAIDLTNDFSKVVKVVREKGEEGLKKLDLIPGKPIKVMLYPKAKDVADAFERLGKPCAFEFKVDGFRLQVHKDENGVKLFTRRLEDVTDQFPEIREYVVENITGESFVLDSEAVGYDKETKEYLPFQFISQRIKRKHGIQEMAKNFPVELNVFDILFYNGEGLIKKPFAERRKLIEKIIKQENQKLKLVDNLITSDIQEAQNFYELAMQKKFEGLMGKKLDAVYKPGSRVGYGLKIKGVLDPLDLVVVAAEWGEGKRTGWFTSFTVACNDDGQLREIGKVGTGFKEKDGEGVSFTQMTELLKPLIVNEEGKTVKVKPEIVISLKFEEIQKSPSYSSGYALRFPRMIMIRDDKPLEEIATLEEIEERFYSG